MKLFDLINTFRSAEDGAVTVDWVVLTAAVIGLGVLALTMVQRGVAELSTKIETGLTAIEPFDGAPPTN